MISPPNPINLTILSPPFPKTFGEIVLCTGLFLYAKSFLPLSTTFSHIAIYFFGHGLVEKTIVLKTGLDRPIQPVEPGTGQASDPGVT